MQISSRSAARVLGLALGVAPWLGGTTTRAQFAYVGTPNPAYSVPYVSPSRTYVPRAWTYYPTPAYTPSYGPYRPNGWGNGSASTSHYGYWPARRPLFLYKPWLSRD